MAVLNGAGDDALMHIWTAVADLSEQLSAHRAAAAELHAQIGVLKSQAVHTQTGFPLRRFNTDKTKEAYEAELERMTTALQMENAALAHDNKQLSALIKEYEQTLENIMSSFRHRAHDTQERELALVRAHEAALLERETAALHRHLQRGAAMSNAVAKMSTALRRALRLAAGEDSEAAAALVRPGQDGWDAERTGVEEWDASRTATWAMGREMELMRLERENEELRRLAGSVDVGTTG